MLNFPVTGSTLLRCSYRHLWSRRRCFSVRWCLRISNSPFDLIGKFFLHTWHHTMWGLWTGSAGPEMKDLVHSIFEKNSPLISTPLSVGVRLLLFFLDVEGPWAVAIFAYFCISSRVVSWLQYPPDSVPTWFWFVVGKCLLAVLVSPKDFEMSAISVALSLSSQKEESLVPSLPDSSLFIIGASVSLSVPVELDPDWSFRAGVWAQPFMRKCAVLDGGGGWGSSNCNYYHPFHSSVWTSDSFICEDLE